MSDSSDRPVVVVERGSSGFGAFVLGALIGAGVALLYAPRSGRETRQELHDGALRLKDTAESTLRQIQDSAQKTLEDVRRELAERVESARNAVEAGRAAARETREEMERRIQRSYDAFRGEAEAGGEPPAAESGGGEEHHS